MRCGWPPGLLALAGCSGGDDDPAAAGSTPAPSSSAAASSSAAEGGTYLALGDSVPFGYRGGQPPESYANAADFVGYPELAAKELGLDLLNASCPGETTESFTDAAAQSNGCEHDAQGRPGSWTAYPLHVPYDAPDQSQLDLAVRTVKDTDDLSLVTLQIGANDAFICQAGTPDRCGAEIVQVAQTCRTT